MLERMRGKGRVSGRKVGNAWVYAAAVPQVDAQRSAWRDFADTVFDGTAGAIRFIARDAKLSDRQRTKLLELLADEEEDDNA